MLHVQFDNAKRLVLWVALGEVTLQDILLNIDKLAADGTWSYPLLYEHLQIMAGRWITVEKETAGRLKFPSKLKQALGHHGEIPHHGGGAQEG